MPMIVSQAVVFCWLRCRCHGTKQFKVCVCDFPLGFTAPTSSHVGMHLQWMGVSNFLSTDLTHAQPTHCHCASKLAPLLHRHYVNVRAQHSWLWWKRDDRTQPCLSFQGSFRKSFRCHAHGNPTMPPRLHVVCDALTSLPGSRNCSNPSFHHRWQCLSAVCLTVHTSLPHHRLCWATCRSFILF